MKSGFGLRDVAIRRGGRTVLDIPSLDIAEGRRYGIVGPNGSGKTTLLEALAGLLPPAAGHVRFRGEDIYADSAALASARRVITCVFQKPALFQGTVFSNVAYPLRLRGVSNQDISGKVETALDSLGLAGFERRAAGSLSGGEMQRVALARALVFEPDVLLVDEPTASVDRAYRHAVMALLTEFAGGRTVIFSTHDPELVSAYASEEIVLDCGRVAAEYPENVYAATLSESGLVLPGGFVVPAPPGCAAHCTVTIDADKVCLKPDDAGWLVRKLEYAGGSVKVIVDVGVPLYVRMPADMFLESGLRPGDCVSVEVPFVAVRLAAARGRDLSPLEPLHER